MAMTLRERALEFLYRQVSENKIPMIRKGMAEDLEQFVLNELANSDAQRVADQMLQKKIRAEEIKAEASDEKNS